MKGKEKGHTDAFLIESYVGQGKILVVTDLSVNKANLSNLGKGEQTAIIEALVNSELLIIDDIKARNRAISLNVDVFGVDFLLLDAYVNSYISFELFQEKLGILSEVMRLKASKILRILKLARSYGGIIDE